MSFVYLAQPYSHPNPATMHARWRVAEEVTAHLIKNGEIIFSPIVHNHALAERYKFETGIDRWWLYDAGMIRACGALLVLTLPGWDTSRGVGREMDLAYKLNTPVDFFDAKDFQTYLHFVNELKV